MTSEIVTADAVLDALLELRERTKRAEDRAIFEQSVNYEMLKRYEEVRLFVERLAEEHCMRPQPVRPPAKKNCGLFWPCEARKFRMIRGDSK
jgi:ribosomal protein S12 methylthiotransferase accessory factor YcaO